MAWCIWLYLTWCMVNAFYSVAKGVLNSKDKSAVAVAGACVGATIGVIASLLLLYFGGAFASIGLPFPVVK